MSALFHLACMTSFSNMLLVWFLFMCLFCFVFWSNLFTNLFALLSQPGNLRSVRENSFYKNLTAGLMGDGRMALLYQNDPSKRLCFIFDLIVSLLTGTFINSLMVNQKLAEWVLSFFLIPWFWIYFIRMPLPNGRVEEGCRMTEKLHTKPFHI